MKFGNKVAGCFMLVALSAIATLTVADYKASTQASQNQYAEHYWSLGHTIKGAFTQMETANNMAVANALHFLRFVEATQPQSLTAARLVDLANKLNMDCLGLSNRQGISQTFSCDPLALGAVNIYDLSQDYYPSLAYSSTPVITPFAPKFHANNFGLAPEKYGYLATESGHHILSASIRSASLEDFLRESTANDPRITRVGLYAPNGDEMAVVLKPVSNTSTDFVTVNLLVKPPSERCGECTQKGLSPRPDHFEYLLRLDVSLEPLLGLIAQKRRQATAVFATGFVISVAISWALSRTLVRRIENMSQVARRAAKTGDLTSRMPLDHEGDEVSSLAAAFNNMLDELQLAEHDRMEKESMRSIAKVASQVAHDIRSPLAALSIVARYTTNIAEENRLLIRDAARRITDIANNLISHYQQHATHVTTDVTAPELLAMLVNSIISEHRTIRSAEGVAIDLQVEDDAHPLFALVNPTLFRRTLSNLLNNAAEAIQGAGLVSVSMHRRAEAIHLQIQDTGSGISAQNLATVLRDKVSMGKVGGSGLGLPGALQAVKSWGGTLTIESVERQGTTVHIELPTAKTPPWFSEGVVIKPNAYVLVLDDDDAITRVWVERFKPWTSTGQLKLHCFKRIDGLADMIETQRERVCACLLDYELLGHKKNGLEVARDLQIESISTLCTSYYEEPHIRATCIAMGMRIIPKTYAAFVRVQAQPNSL